ncbi:MAG: serine/threonine protein kinase [Planctomycetota bacterium]|nr:MAG: serine/threonine protein kinase [Planctomycetota bacterium]
MSLPPSKEDKEAKGSSKKKDKKKAHGEEKLFGKMALKMKWVTKAHLKEARKIQKAMRELGIYPKSLAEILVEKGYLEEDKVPKVWEAVKKEMFRKIQIEGYEILDKLGKGSVATVYKARQKSLDRLVAIKILHPDLQDDEIYLERFFREARGTANLDSPYIVKGLDIVETQKGHYGLVVEYVDGEALHKILKEKGKFGEREAASLILPLLEALMELDRKNMIHRDIKPSNIILSPEGPKLCDFGLAKPLGSDPSITQSGITLGSPHYISPEQARGMDLDIRSDIFSLGVVFFEMVTGEKPFENSENLIAVIARSVTEDIPSPSEKNPFLTSEISFIISKMTKRNREERYRTPQEVMEDLKNYLEGKPLDSFSSKEDGGATSISTRRKKFSRGKKKKKIPLPVPAKAEKGLEDSTSFIKGMTKKNKTPEEKEDMIYVSLPNTSKGESTDFTALRAKKSRRKGQEALWKPHYNVVIAIILIAVYFFLTLLVNDKERSSLKRRKKSGTYGTQKYPPPSKSSYKNPMNHKNLEDQQTNTDPAKLDALEKKLKKKLEKSLNKKNKELLKMKLALLAEAPKIWRQILRLLKEGKTQEASQEYEKLLKKLDILPPLKAEMAKKSEWLKVKSFDIDLKKLDRAYQKRNLILAQEWLSRLKAYNLAKQKKLLLLWEKKLEELKRQLAKENEESTWIQWSLGLEEAGRWIAKGVWEKAMEALDKKSKALIPIVKKIETLAIMGLNLNLGAPKFSLALNHGKVVFGRIIQVNKKKKTFFLLSQKGGREYNLFELAPSQIFQLALQFCKSQKKKGRQEERILGLFCLMACRDVEKAYPLLKKGFGTLIMDPQSWVGRIYGYFHYKLLTKKILQYQKSQKWYRILLYAQNLWPYLKTPWARFYRSKWDGIIQDAIRQSGISNTCHGKVTWKDGNLVWEYVFRSKMELDDWITWDEKEGIQPGKWNWKKDGLFCTGGPKLIFKIPLQGRISISIETKIRGRPSIAVFLCCKKIGHRFYGFMAGLGVPLGDSAIFHHFNQLEHDQLYWSGLFEWSGIREIHPLFLASFTIPVKKGRIFLEAGFLPPLKKLWWRYETHFQEKKIIKEWGHWIGIQCWKSTKIEKITIRGIPKETL